MLALILLLQAAGAQTPAATAPNTTDNTRDETKKLGAIEGRVVNAKTGEALRRANVTLRPMGGPGMGGPGMITSGPFPMAAAAPYAASTDAEGKFRIERVEAGDYRMSAERQGFMRGEYGARQNSMMGTTVKLSSGQEMREMEIKLLPQAIVTGKVLDEEGEPLAQVQIQVMRRRYFRGKIQPMPMGGGMTQDTGDFRIANLAPGKYWISAVHRSPMAMFEGPARNTADKPEEAYVTTYHPSSLDSAGARQIDLQAGQEAQGIDIRMRKARVFRVRGKVAGAGSPRNMRLVMLPRESIAFFGFGPGGGMVKEDGTFEIGNVQPGAYYLTTMPMQPGTTSGTGRVAVDVGQANVENVLLTLGGGSSMKGTVRIDGDVQKLEARLGRKVALDTMRVQPMPTGPMPFGVSAGTVKEDGSFAIENVNPDKYRLIVMGMPQETYLKSVRIGDQDAQDGTFEALPGVPLNVQLTLAIGVGKVTGVVQDAKQKPASGATVTLLPYPMKDERNDMQRVGSTDQNGQFTLQGVPPGEYKIWAWEDVEPGTYMDPEFLKKHESLGQKVSVKPDSQQQVSISQVSAEATAAQ